MNIYKVDKKSDFIKVIDNNTLSNNKRRNILLNLPCYSLSDELLNGILSDNNVTKGDKEIIYNYEQYLKHIELLKKFKKEHKNYDYKIKNNYTFKNINIFIIENKQVIISKINSPVTNFVIHHPDLVNAIQNFEVSIIEKESDNITD